MSSPTQYVVVRYVPDPVADERINIGVLATDGDRAAWTPISNWDRAKAFGGEDVTFLQEFSQKLSQDISGGELTGANASELMQRGQGWMNSIQMSNVKASLEPLETFMQTFPQTVLKPGAGQQQQARSSESPEMWRAASVIESDSRSKELSLFSEWNAREFYDLHLLTEYSDMGCAIEAMEKAWPYCEIVEEYSDLEEVFDHLGDKTIGEFVQEVFDFKVEPNTNPVYASPLTYLQAVASDSVQVFEQPTYREFYAQLEKDWHERNNTGWSAPTKALALVRQAAETDVNAITEENELLQPMRPALKLLRNTLMQDKRTQANGKTEIQGDDYRIIATPESFEIRRNQDLSPVLQWNKGEVVRLNSTVDKNEAALLTNKLQTAAMAIATSSRPTQAKAANLEI